MSNRDTINQLFRHLADAPLAVDNCSSMEVLTALGMMAQALMEVAFTDRAARRNEADRFCATLRRCIDQNIAREQRQQHSAQMSIH
jgi:hypothetical protein